MHPKFTSMNSPHPSSRCSLHSVGDGHIDLLKRQAEELGVAELDFQDDVEDIRSILEVADVYGYLLC